MSDLITDNIKKPDFEIAVRGVKERFLQIADEKVFIREAGLAIQQIKGNSQLQSCSKESIQDAVVNIALTGSTLNPILQQAYLIPRKGKCCLDFSYRGLLKLAVDSESVFDMDATCVFSKDDFFYEMGLSPNLIHKPSLDEDRGEFIFVYAVAILSTGIKKFIVLNKAEVEKIRKLSQVPDGPMWKEFYEEAARKTAIKKLYKLLPQTDKLSHAVWVVNQHEGIDFEAIRGSNAKKLMEKFKPKKTEETKLTPADPVELGSFVQQIESSKSITEIEVIWKEVLAKGNAIEEKERKTLTELKNKKKKELNIEPKNISVIEKCRQCKKNETCMMTPEQRKLCKEKE